METTLIVGAGLAGARCAETLRANGYAGRVLLVGEEPFAPYERPALSKELLAGSRDEVSLRPDGFWESQGIELWTGTRVTSVDPVRRTAVAGGAVIGWDALVLATGARPRRLLGPLPGNVHELRTLADALALREELRPGRRLVVVGSGFVGAEAATTAAALGLHVTVVEAGSAPLGGLLGPDVGDLLTGRYGQRGIELVLGAAVERVTPHTVRLADGRRIGFDLLLVAIGVEPARELVSSGLPPRVLLAGDVTGTGHWTAAAEQGKAAALSLLGLEAAPQQPSYVWSDQLGLRLQLVGDPRGAVRVELEGEADGFAGRFFDDAGGLVAALAANRPALVPAFRRELAALPSAA
jgi:3-phenylpropionate/trans-cinnamate dioxygenase ferredoxin reductase subunit